MAGLRQRLATCALLTAALLAASAGAAMAAAPNQLIGPSITPTSASEGTTFLLSVTYQGRHPAVSVQATVGSLRVPLKLVSGTATDGVFTGAAVPRLGAHPVTFLADATQGNDPELAGGTLTVTAATPAPTPTPVPAPVVPPPPVATPAPTAVAPAPVAPAPVAPAPAPPTGDASALVPPADGTVTDQASAPASEATSATAPADGSSAAETAETAGWAEAATVVGSSLVGSGPFGSTDDLLITVLAGGIGVIGLVVVFGFAMGRRRREPQAAAVAPVFTAPALAEAPRVEARRAPAAWELAAQLDDAPLGTVDFAPLPNGLTIGEMPDNVEPIERPKRMNPRMARIMAARGAGGQLWGS